MAARTAAVLVSLKQARHASALMAHVGGFRLEVISARPGDVVSARYRSSSVALIANLEAIVRTSIAHRVTRVPWLVLLDECDVARLRADPMGRTARALAGAAAVVVPREIFGNPPTLLQNLRLIPEDDAEHLSRVLRDVALAEDARGNSRAIGSFVADAVSFLNDRATRLAIRLVPILRKAPTRLHPKHLVAAPWHFWYRSELRSGDRVLDVGCAGGTHSLYAAKIVHSVVGVDVDAAELEQARITAAAKDLQNVTFEKIDLTEADLSERLERLGVFDLVILLDVLEHLEERVGTLRALRRAMTPRARIVISVPRRDTPYKAWRRRLGGFAYSDADHKTEYTDQGIFHELKVAGFEVTRLEFGGYDTPFAGPTALIGAFSLRGYSWLSRRRYERMLDRPDWATAIRVVARVAEP